MEKVLFPSRIKKEYLSDLIDSKTKPRYRAIAVRSCLELLLEHLFYIFVKNHIEKEDWNILTVNNKIKIIKNHTSFNGSFYKKLDKLRKVGNKGAHASEHDKITDEELSDAFYYLSNICISLIFEYFKKNGMQSTESTSTIFSCLQPQQRVEVLCQYTKVLEKIEYDSNAAKNFYSKYINAYFSNNVDETEYQGNFPKPLRLRQSLNKNLSAEFWASPTLQHYDELLIAIDKLSLAYLKSGSIFLATCTLYHFYVNGHLTESYYDEQCEKLEKLKQKLDEYPIAKNQTDSINNLKEIERICASDLDKSFAKLINCMLTNEN